MNPAPRLSQIDELTRRDHSYLGPEDVCYYLLEYTKPLPGQRAWQASETNNFIWNLKKSPERRGRAEWRHKETAITKAGALLRAAVGGEKLAGVTLVPMPPSRAKADPLHDDRMSRVLAAACRGLSADIRELLHSLKTMVPVHERTVRPSIDEIRRNLATEPGLLPPHRPALRDEVWLVDDMLVTGAHFRAARSLLLEADPTLRVVGVFLARRALPAPPPDDDRWF